MPTTWNALFLGNIATQIDPFEGNTLSENFDDLAGRTFGSSTPGEQLFENIVSVTAIDNGGAADALDTNNFASNDQMQFDLGDGAGLQTTVYDGGGVYNATLTYSDGTTANITAVIIQDVNGNLFLAPEFSNNSDVAAMEAGAITSITLNTVSIDTGNFTDDRVLTNFICYAAGSRIATPDGPRPIEALRAGDLVLTADRGAQPVRWIRSSRVIATGKQAPVRIRQGALGQGLPARDLMVSRQHRVLIRSAIVQRMFGAHEVLLPAIRLVGLPGIDLAETGQPITYWHLLMDRHEVLFAEGAPAESLLPGPFALDAMGPEARADLEQLYPDLISRNPREGAARPIPSLPRQRKLVERHLRNRKPLLDTAVDQPRSPRMLASG
ncbi:MAG: Hint domain-containing protein [Pseudomonadota bacterium]